MLRLCWRGVFTWVFLRISLLTFPNLRREPLQCLDFPTLKNLTKKGFVIQCSKGYVDENLSIDASISEVFHNATQEKICSVRLSVIG